MTSTSVKDVGSVLNSLAPTVGGSAKTSADKTFQTVLNDQTDRNQGESRTTDSQPDKSQAAVKKTPGDSLKAKDAHMERVADQKPAESEETLQESEEIPAEKLEEVMEVLGTAAADLMQQIADTFDISLEELEGTMQELGMDSLDVLDQGKLGALLLQLGGAQDASALVTNGELYENYQELMTSLEELIQETGQETGLNPEQLQTAIQPESPKEPVLDEVPVEVVVETEDIPQAQPKDEMPVETEDVQAQVQQPLAEVPESQPAEKDESQSGQETERRQSEPHRSEHHHMFTQDVRTDQFQSQFSTQVQETATASNVSRTDTQDIMRQIMDYMRIQVKVDTSSLEMQLHPESLGSLHIQIASRAGMVTANFIAQNETVKAALESQIVQLRESFEEQGVKVEAIEVTVQSHAFERNLDQGREQSGEQEQHPSAKRTRTRRINLNDSLEMENLEEEDALAAEMMAASGSQVDYTA